MKCRKKVTTVHLASRFPETWRSILLGGAVGFSTLTAALGNGAAAQAAPTYTVIWSFEYPGGESPRGGLIKDDRGNLYGTTTHGGAYNYGVVYELSPPVTGQTAWTQTVLHSLQPKGDISNAGLIADKAGNLYGTVQHGGPIQGGAVIQLIKPTGDKPWKEKVLLGFDGTNGDSPWGGLIADSAGNLYGTTIFGGASYVGRKDAGDGVVFELSPPPAGQTAWTETVLQSFSGANGAYPTAGLIADGAGNLYGTAGQGGVSNDGVVFELSPPAAGQTVWKETVLQSFNGPNGANPTAGLIADGAGNLYGTTFDGGANKYGVMFELSPPVAGQTAWNETVLVSFRASAGEYPYAGLLADGAGNLYGTAEAGGKGEGVAFEFTP